MTYMHLFAHHAVVAALSFALAAAAPAGATVAGDCDADGETGIAELQQCINIFLGEALLELCPACSVQGEEVGIVDLQASINCFLDTTSDSCPMVELQQTPTASATSTNTPLPTSTPAPPTLTATPTVNPAVCGNGLLEGSETCTSCAADCNVSSCTAVATPPRTFRVDYAAPAGQPVSAVKVRLAYRSNLMSLPGTGNASAARVKNRPSNTTTIINDFNYALEVTMSKSGELPQGRLFTVDFDGCSGAAQPVVSDLYCTILDCGSSFGPVSGCTCLVRLP